MSDMIADGLKWIAEVAHADHAAKMVTYKRGEEEIEVRATIALDDNELEDGSGVIDRWVSRDFLIPAVDLVFDAGPSIPAAGDVIIEDSLEYPVFAPPGLSIFQDDGFGTRFQVKTWRRAAAA